MGAGGGDELKLLGMWASPFAVRVQLALRLKGLSYEYVEEDLNSKSELLLKSNPVHSKVPVLLHNGNPVCESSVILQYIDEAFAGTGPSLLPSDPYAQAAARFLAAFIDDTLLKARSRALRGKTDEEMAEGRMQSAAAMDALEGALRGKPFFGGDGVGLVDVMLGGLLASLRATDAMRGVETFDPAATPLLAAWAERFGALDAVQPVMPGVERLIEYFEAVQARDVATAASSAGATN